MISGNCTNPIEWLGLRLAVPDDWQIVRHSLNPRRGALSLVDRRRQRMQIGWTQCEQSPDLEHMLNDYRARTLESDPDSDIARIRGRDGWKGSRRTAEDAVLTRAIRFDRRTNRLVEAVILTEPDNRDDDQLVHELLEAIEVTAPATEARRFRAFGVQIEAPEGWRLTRLSVKPADVTAHYRRFDPDRQRETRTVATVNRRGLADGWFNGDTETLLRLLATDAAVRVTQGWYRGRRVHRAEGPEQVKRWERWAGRERLRQDVCYHEKEENAVYHIATWSPVRTPVPPDRFVVESATREAVPA